MTFFKFMFVLALAVPLAVFMWNYINKLSAEFQKSLEEDREKSEIRGARKDQMILLRMPEQIERTRVSNHLN